LLIRRENIKSWNVNRFLYKTL